MSRKKAQKITKSNAKSSCHDTHEFGRRSYYAFFVLFCAFLRLMSCSVYGSAQAQKSVVTYMEVKPILQARCVVCHKQEMVGTPAVSGGLALDTFAGIKKKGIVAAGKSADSELYKRLITTSPTKLMPKGGPALPDKEIALIKKWIDDGASAGSVKNDVPQKAAGIVPMPPNPARENVMVKTRIVPTADLKKKETPGDATIDFALKIGPLPPVTALAFSPDGKILAAGVYRAVLLWDTATGKPLPCLMGLAGAVQSVAWRPDGSALAVAGGLPGASGEVKCFDTKTWQPINKSFGGQGDVVYSVAWSADGNKLAAASQDKTAKVWEWATGKELWTLKDHSDAVMRVVFAPDGKSLYTASQDKNVRRFNLDDGKLMRQFSGHNEGVGALALSPDGNRLISAGTEPQLRWWNIGDGNTARNDYAHEGGVNDIVFSKDGKWIASAGADKRLRIWQADNAAQQRALAGATDWEYTAAFSPDAKWTAGGGADGLIRLWETATGRLRLILAAYPPAGTQATGIPEWAALTPEGVFDASANWTAILKPQLALQPISAAQVTAFLPTLKQPDAVLKAWQMAALEPAKLPDPPAPKTSSPRK